MMSAHCLVVAATGELIRKPQNVIGLREDPLVLECFSNTSSVLWSYNGSKVNVAGCTATHPSFTTTADSNDTHCSLVVQGTNTARLSGRYTCSDGKQTAVAFVIIVGQYTFRRIARHRDTDPVSVSFLWLPYVIGQAIKFLPCGFFFYLSFYLFPRLISAVADWVSAILPHMVWPWCEFTMQV